MIKPVSEIGSRPAVGAGQPVPAQHDDAAGNFLVWVLGLHDQDAAVSGVPPGQDDPVRKLATRLAGCVAAGCLTGTDRLSALEVAAHIGGHSRGGRLPAWALTGLRQAERMHGKTSGGAAAGSTEPIAAEPGRRVIATRTSDGRTCRHGRLCEECYNAATEDEFAHRAAAVGCGREWPYGPNINYRARFDLVAWAEREGLRWAPNHRCFHWLTKGRCGVAQCEGLNRGWADHVTAWINKDGRPDRIVAQPYQLTAAGLLDLAAIQARPGVNVVVTGGGWYGAGWYGHGSVCIELRRPPTQPNEKAIPKARWPGVKVTYPESAKSSGEEPRPAQ